MDMVLNDTLKNISVISWRSVVLLDVLLSIVVRS
jgi:hypothetical protein